MTKSRKEYMNEAERCMLRLITAYYKDHGKLPESYSVLKSSLTRAYNKVGYEVAVKIRQELGVHTAPYLQDELDRPDYPKAVDKITKEMESVDDFWLRFSNS